MIRTVGDVVTRVRTVLQDETGVRYLTAQLIGFINDALIEARSIRPDLFIDTFGTDLVAVTATTDPFPLPLQFFPAVCFYVAGRAELRDDEFSVDGRAMMLLNAYGKKLVAGA